MIEDTKCLELHLTVDSHCHSPSKCIYLGGWRVVSGQLFMKLAHWQQLPWALCQELRHEVYQHFWMSAPPRPCTDIVCTCYTFYTIQSGVRTDFQDKIKSIGFIECIYL